MNISQRTGEAVCHRHTILRQSVLQRPRECPNLASNRGTGGFIILSMGLWCSLFVYQCFISINRLAGMHLPLRGYSHRIKHSKNKMTPLSRSFFTLSLEFAKARVQQHETCDEPHNGTTDDDGKRPPDTVEDGARRRGNHKRKSVRGTDKPG